MLVVMAVVVLVVVVVVVVVVVLVLVTLMGHRSGIKSLTFHPYDGNVIATGSSDTNVKVRTKIGFVM